MSQSFVFKILVVGEGGCGKTSLIDRIVNQRFQGNYLMTIGVNVSTKETNIDNIRLNLQFMDIGGQDKFEPLRGVFYKGAKAAILVFDLTRYATWQKIEKWNNEINEYCGNIPRILLGNKKDLEIKSGAFLDKEEIFTFSNENQIEYYETSAAENTNVETALNALGKMLIDSYKLK
jgi:Ras-related protein Rab-35